MDVPYHRRILLVISLGLLICMAPLAQAKTASSRTFNTDELFPTAIDAPGEKVIIVNPHVHAWAAYSASGELIRTGIATSGSGWCRDLHRACRTKVGTFRIYSLGNSSCKSHKFPLPRGGAPMPYCMYFNGGQALHGSYEIARANLSHGCVRLRVNDAEWLRYDFVEGPNTENGFQGTKVIIKPY